MGVVFAGGVYTVMRPGPKPWTQCASVWKQTVGVLGALLNSKQTGVSASDLSGPLGILAAMAVETKTDYRRALSFLVLLNISLAVLNLLPLPVLDGGHILLAVIERIRRRPLNVRLVEYVTNAFALLLISFVLYVTFFDVRRLPAFKAMLQRDSHVEDVGRSRPVSPVTNAVGAQPAR